MKKLILKLGWPGALLLLVSALSLGVYAVINQSISDEEKKEISEEIAEIIPNNITKKPDHILKLGKDKPKEESLISKNLNNIEEKIFVKIISLQINKIGSKPFILLIILL